MFIYNYFIFSKNICNLCPIQILRFKTGLTLTECGIVHVSLEFPKNIED